MRIFTALLKGRGRRAPYGKIVRRAVTTFGLSIAVLVAPVLGTVPVHAAPTVTTYPLPGSSSFPYRITKGPDGALWFTEQQGRKIGTITSAGAITEYPVPNNYQPLDITAGPDGNLWFTGQGSPFLYRITTSGTITSFSALSAPYAVAAGSDGALWFTTQAFGSNAWEIGRMTTAGAVTLYPIAGNLSSFLSITAGPDGAVWFSEQGNDPGDNAIGRMTTAGVYSRYTTPTASSFPMGITTGPDGAIWFTETNAANIGRIDTAGNITEYPIPSGEHPASGIATGPDGALWYSGGGSYGIGRITTTGSVTQYPLTPATGATAGVTGGFDGAVWYTVGTAGSSAIGRITTPAPVALQSINAGGTASGSFAADTGFSGGSTYTSSAAVDTSETSTPAPQAVYQSVRYGNFSYGFSGLTPGAAYTLRLHFNELYWGAGSNSGGIGSRVFNVAVNGQGALSNYDIYQQAGGANKAITEQVPATADASGNIAIQFTTVTDNAMVNGIELFDGTLPPQPPRPPQPAFSTINAGGNVSGSFAADTEFSGGSTYASSTAVDTSAVTNPAPQAVYQSVRYGNFTYTVPQLTAGANYRVRLHFNELYWGAGSNGGGAGSRVFNVTVNGSPVLSNYDIYAAAGGANKAIVQEFVVPADAQGNIAIQFTTVVDNAMVNGIEVNPA